MTQKNFQNNIIFLLKNWLFKNLIEITLQTLFNIFLLFNTVPYIKLNFKLKIDPKMYTFKNLEEIWKTWKKIGKTNATSVKLLKCFVFFIVFSFINALN